MIKYRKANDNDFDLTFTIKSNSLRSYIEAIWGWDEKKQIQYHSKQFNSYNIQIIIEDNKEVGFIDIIQTEKVIFIANLLIDKPFQGKGIGRTVLQGVITNAANQNKTIELQVFKINKKAKSLYERLNFKIVGHTDLHYKMRYEPEKNKLTTTPPKYCIGVVA